MEQDQQARLIRLRVMGIGPYRGVKAGGAHLRAIAQCDRMQRQQSPTCYQHVNTGFMGGLIQPAGLPLSRH